MLSYSRHHYSVNFIVTAINNIQNGNNHLKDSHLTNVTTFKLITAF